MSVTVPLCASQLTVVVGGKDPNAARVTDAYPGALCVLNDRRANSPYAWAVHRPIPSGVVANSFLGEGPTPAAAWKAAASNVFGP